MPKLTQMILSKTRIVRIGLEISLVSVLRAAKCVWSCLQRWNSVTVDREVCLSLLQTLTTINISFTIDWGINDIYLQEMWYLSSNNIHCWFLSTITAGAPESEQSQSYRQSLSPDFYVKKFWCLICAFFISVLFVPERVYLIYKL